MDAIINNALMGLSSSKNAVAKAADNIAKSSVNEQLGRSGEAKVGLDETELVEKVDKSAGIGLAGEMVDLIQASRNYEFNLRVVDTWSEMMKNTIEIGEDKK
jgi:flagellar hook protein FlgE